MGEMELSAVGQRISEAIAPSPLAWLAGPAGPSIGLLFLVLVTTGPIKRRW